MAWQGIVMDEYPVSGVPFFAADLGKEGVAIKNLIFGQLDTGSIEHRGN